MGFIGMTLSVAVGTILADAAVIKIVTSKTAIDAMKKKTEDVVNNAVTKAIGSIFNKDK